MSVVCISNRLQVRHEEGKENTIEIPFELTLTMMETVTRTVSRGLKLNRLVLIV
jgi:hypothetical protein